MLRQVPFVGIAGNIAVGKTTLTRILSSRLGWRAFYESVDDNPYLQDFYADMKKWSFHLQIYFLSRRFQTQREMARGNRPAVQDRTIYEDVEIFARSLFEGGAMTERDWNNYRTLFKEMTSYLSSPALIVYLKASTDTLMTRVRKRGREYERRISPEYLHRLNVAYDRWIHRASGQFPVLTVETDDFDFLVESPRRDELIAAVESRCQNPAWDDNRHEPTN
ncbi:MAG: deoxynucleoside kinase [Fidelibacterota bacterium]